eukprot:293728_1
MLCLAILLRFILQQTNSCEDVPIDIAILVDTSCPMTVKECKLQQIEVAEFVKELQSTGSKRISYIEFDSNNINTLMDFDHPNNNNENNNSKSYLDNVYELISNRDICDVAEPRNGNPNLFGALKRATKQFTSYDENAIVIVNNCGIQETEIERIAQHMETHFTLSDTPMPQVFIINNRPRLDSITDPYSYLAPLVEYDTDRIFVHESKYDSKNTPHFAHITMHLIDRICQQSAPSPTSNPTNDPTRDPTTDPTRNPTAFPTSTPVAWICPEYELDYDNKMDVI